MIDVYHFCMAMYHKDCEKFDTYKYREYSVVMFKAIKKNTVLVVGSKKGGE